MNAKEIITTIMKNKKIKQCDLMSPMGMPHQSAVSQALNRDMKITMLLRFLNALNCEIVIRDRDTGEEWTLE